jgi:hypothetical protein
MITAIALFMLGGAWWDCGCLHEKAIIFLTAASSLMGAVLIAEIIVGLVHCATKSANTPPQTGAPTGPEQKKTG